MGERPKHDPETACICSKWTWAKEMVGCANRLNQRDDWGGRVLSSCWINLQLPLYMADSVFPKGFRYTIVSIYTDTKNYKSDAPESTPNPFSYTPTWALRHSYHNGTIKILGIHLDNSIGAPKPGHPNAASFSGNRSCVDNSAATVRHWRCMRWFPPWVPG